MSSTPPVTLPSLVAPRPARPPSSTKSCEPAPAPVCGGTAKFTTISVSGPLRAPGLTLLNGLFQAKLAPASVLVTALSFPAHTALPAFPTQTVTLPDTGVPGQAP